MRLTTTLLKLTVTVLTLGLFFTSCATQRRCLEKYPPVTTIQIKDSIAYRDTTVYVPLPADTITKDTVIVLPCPTPPDFKTPKVKARNRFASAEAWLEGNRLKLRLMQNDTTLAFVIDSALTEYKKTITVTQGHVVKEKYVPAFYKASLFISILAVVLLILKFVVNLKR